MSWLFSRALVEEYSGATCLDGEPSVPLSVMPTPQPFLLRNRTPAFCEASQFGLTCERLTGDRGAELLTWFLGASPARTFPSPEQVMASTVSAPGSGQKWHGSLATFDPATHSWRTAQFSLLGGSDEFLETWPRWGTTRDGELYLLPMPALPTCESESGLWPTPCASDTGSRKTKYAQGGTALSLAVKYPTPTAGNRKSGGYLAEWGGSRSRAAMAELVPPEEMLGPLNPEWVEWLMGWPTGWTGLGASEMDKSRNAPSSPGDCSPAEEAA